jgi:hypothetical protein
MSDADNMRGIQNAEARYPTAEDRQITRSNERLTSERLRRPRNRRARSSDNDKIISSYFEKMNEAEMRRLSHRVRDIFKNGGFGADDSDIRELSEMRAGKVEKPSFPYFILIIAVLKDIVDVVATATLVGVVFSIALSFLFSLILFFWTLGKINGMFGYKKKMIGWLLRRCGVVIIIEFIPGVNIIPTTTIFILMAHYRETKVVKLINLALEELYRAGVR